MKMSNKISVRIDSDESHQPIENVKVTFGPHHFVDIMKNNGGIKFVMGVTHHAYVMDASKLNSEFEQLIWKLKENNPDNSVD